MRKKINDMIYTLLSRLSYDEHKILGEVNFTSRIMGLMIFLEHNPEYLYDNKILNFFELVINNKITKEKLEEMETYIKKYDPKSKKYTLTEFAQMLRTDTKKKEELIEKCKEIQLEQEFTKKAIMSLKELIIKDEMGEDITDISNMELFRPLNFINLKPEEKDSLINLYISWQKQIEKEYYETKNKKPQTIGLLLPLNGDRLFDYPKTKDISNCEVDVKENANYFRDLLKQGENSYADTLLSLLGNGAQTILLRIVFDIENELGILDSYENISVEEMLVIEELKSELLTEKQDVLRKLGGISKWK